MVTANDVGFFPEKQIYIGKFLILCGEFITCYTDENVYWLYKFSCNVLRSFMVFHT